MKSTTDIKMMLGLAVAQERLKEAPRQRQIAMCQKAYDTIIQQEREIDELIRFARAQLEIHNAPQEDRDELESIVK